jgi:hypothetical protein
VTDEVITAQSFGMLICDTLYAKAVTLPFFAGFVSRRTQQLPTVTESLPFLGVYFLRENMNEDGDGNAGEVRFINDMTVGFSIIIQNNDPVDTRTKLDAAFWAIMNGIWRDQYIMCMGIPIAPPGTITLPYGIQIESIKSGNRKIIWGNPDRSNESPIAEMQYEAVVRYRSTFPPIITDDLLRIHVETVPTIDGVVPPNDEVLRIISEYEFTPARAEKAAA